MVQESCMRVNLRGAMKSRNMHEDAAYINVPIIQVQEGCRGVQVAGIQKPEEGCTSGGDLLNLSLASSLRFSL